MSIIIIIISSSITIAIPITTSQKELQEGTNNEQQKTTYKHTCLTQVFYDY